MKKHSVPKSVLLHLYPGVLITLFFVIVTPFFVKNGLPPQLSMLTAIAFIVTPVLLIHLQKAKRNEQLQRIWDLNKYNNKLSSKKMILYTLGLVVFAFIVYGATQPLNVVITEKLLSWLPDWYKVSNFEGYSKNIVIITLVLNFLLNGFLAPVLEEIYFRGYLMQRIKLSGFWVPLSSAFLFSIYHFWQPQIYLTLIIALFPMVYLTWKTKNLKLAIYTHCGLNIVGALLSFAMVFQA